MATEILLPKIGFAMSEGQIAEWLAADGTQVAEGQPLYLLEADKSTNEVEAPASGTILIDVWKRGFRQIQYREVAAKRGVPGWRITQTGIPRRPSISARRR